MPVVYVTLALSCGCIEALVEAPFRPGDVVACSVDVCLGKWWCECADPYDPQQCEHVDVLASAVEAGIDGG